MGTTLEFDLNESRLPILYERHGELVKEDLIEGYLGIDEDEEGKYFLVPNKKIIDEINKGILRVVFPKRNDPPRSGVRFPSRVDGIVYGPGPSIRNNIRYRAL